MKIKKYTSILLTCILLSTTFLGTIKSQANNEINDEKKVLNFKEEKIGIALAGGGLLGSYELGALQYLKEQGIEIADFDSAIGTSVGSLVLASTLSNGLDETTDLFLNVEKGDIYNGNLSNSKYKTVNYILEKMYTQKDNKGNLALIARGFVSGQLDTTPLRELINSNIDEDKVLNSGVEVGFCVSSTKNIITPKCKNGEELEGKVSDWVIASSSCWPVFKPYEVDGTLWIDGGYADSANEEILFKEFNCDKVVVLDLMQGQESERDDIIHVIPTVDLGSFLDTTPSQIESNYNQGYEDCKAYFEENVTIIK